MPSELCFEGVPVLMESHIPEGVILCGRLTYAYLATGGVFAKMPDPPDEQTVNVMRQAIHNGYHPE